MPTISATGVKIGITTAARPEPDVMTGFKAKLISTCSYPEEKAEMPSKPMYIHIR